MQDQAICLKVHHLALPLHNKASLLFMHEAGMEGVYRPVRRN